jgi:dCMP deaminase
MRTHYQSLMAAAKDAALNSPDPNTKVGCYIKAGKHLIRSWNDFPAYVNKTVPERLERPLKYKWIEHAEREAIYYAAQRGYALLGGTMILPWYPCADCARAIIQSGLHHLVCYEPNWLDEKWGPDFRIAHEMLTEAGVIVTYEVP